MTCHVVAVGLAKGLPAGKAGAEDRGLSELGAILGAREGILADHAGRGLEQVRSQLRHEAAHVRGLAPLTRKQNRRVCLAYQRTHGCRYRYRGSSHFPPFGGRLVTMRTSPAT